MIVLTDEERGALFVAIFPDAKAEWLRGPIIGGMEPLAARLDQITPAVERIVAARIEARLAAVRALVDDWVANERRADEYGPTSHYNGYDCASELRAALNPAPEREADGAAMSGGE